MSIGIDFELRAKTASFNSALNAVNRDLGSIGTRLEHQFTGRHLGTALATAFGLNIEKIGEHFARMFTGVTEEEEKAYKELEGLTTRVADASIKNMHAMLSDNQKLNLALQDRARLEEAIANNSGKTAAQQVKQAEDRLGLEEKIAEARELQNKIAEAAEKEAERMAKMTDDVKKEFADAEKQRIAELNKRLQEESDQTNANFRIAEKVKEEAAEKEIKNQEELNQLVLDEVKARQEAAEVAKQAAERYASAIQGLASQTKMLFDQSTKQLFVLGASGGKQFNEASEGTLQEVLRRNSSKLQGLRPGSAFSYGDDMEIARLKTENANAQKELDFRRGFLGDVSRGGVDSARRNFAGDPLQFDRVLQQLTSGLGNGDKQTKLLEEIKTALGGKFVNQ